MQNSFFDLQNRYASLSKTGDPLERLNAIIDWELFRPLLERMDAKERKSNAGRKPTCRILMFKMLILQGLHGLSDESLQYQVTDRLSFMRFLGVELAGNVSDARTVWTFREALKEHQLADALFDRLNQTLADLGIELKSGQIIDATFVPVPIQRNRRESNALIKAGAVPIDWGQDTDKPNKLAHKDTDARWTKKGGKTTTVTRTTSTLTKTPNSLPATPARMPACMTVKYWRRYCAMKKQEAKRSGQTALTAQKSKNKASKTANTPARSTSVLTVASL
jgi:transposase, IS5 family